VQRADRFVLQRAMLIVRGIGLCWGGSASLAFHGGPVDVVDARAIDGNEKLDFADLQYLTDFCLPCCHMVGRRNERWPTSAIAVPIDSNRRNMALLLRHTLYSLFLLACA